MNPKQETAFNRVIAALDDLLVELSKIDRELVARRTTLDAFCLQLKKMATNIETGDLPPKTERKSGMGRGVVDGWPLAHPLGEKIIIAEQAYLGL
jgi:hypothetical protein